MSIGDYFSLAMISLLGVGLLVAGAVAFLGEGMRPAGDGNPWIGCSIVAVGLVILALVIWALVA